MNSNTKDDVTAVVRYKNAIVRIHGEPPENLPEIMTEFMKKVIQQKARQSNEKYTPQNNNRYSSMCADS